MSRRLLRLLMGLLALTCSVAVAAEPALIAAIRDGQTQQALAMLDEGVSPEATTPDGEFESKTALMWAAETGEVAVLDALLAAGAEVDRPNNKSGTALMYAAVAGELTALEHLLGAGADPNVQVRHGWSPLLLATVKGHVDILEALVGAGADIQVRDVYDWTLLMRAVDVGERAMVERLLELGLSPSAGDEAGNNAHTVAADQADPWFAERLEDADPEGARAALSSP